MRIRLEIQARLATTRRTRQLVVIGITASPHQTSWADRERRFAEDDDRIDIVVQAVGDFEHSTQLRCFSSGDIVGVLKFGQPKKNTDRR